jgi:hypothetical protein
MQSQEETIKYCNYLEDVRIRLSVVQKFTQGKATLKKLGREDFDIEFVAIQLRKSLEGIAFSTLIANKDIYSRQYKNFSKHWNPKYLLNDIERFNPDFYPKPLGVISEPDENGIKNIEYLEDGYLTKDDFVFLYDKCGKALHTLNPYSNSSVIDLKLSVHEWVQRILKLLYIHQVRLLDDNETFVVYLQHPETGKVKAIKAVAVEEIKLNN